MTQSKTVTIHEAAILYGKNSIGKGSRIMENVILGYPDRELLKKMEGEGKEIEHYPYQGVITGKNALIRSGTIIYCNVRIGDNFQTGHHVMVREENRIGDNVSIGTSSVVEHHVCIGDNVRIHSQAFIPEETTLEAGCWIGPNVVITNARYPLSPGVKSSLRGATVRKNAKIGANATLLPGVVIGENALVGAGTVVTRNVPSGKVVVGNPAQVIRDISELPY